MSAARPHKSKLEALRDYLHHTDAGNCDLLGIDAQVWDDTPISDLLVLQPEEREDAISRWIHQKYTAWWLRHFSRKGRQTGSAAPSQDPEKPYAASSALIEYEEKGYNILAMLLTSLMSVLMFVSPIIILYFVEDMLARLLAVAAFVAIFSLCLSLLLQAKKVEVFAATAA